MTSFFTQKIDCTIKFSKISMNCQVGALKHALFIYKKKNIYIYIYISITYITIFKKEKARELITSRFFKVMYSCFKLGAFGHALSPLSGTSKNHSLIFKKKKKKRGERFFLKNKRSSCIKVSKLGAFG